MSVIVPKIIMSRNQKRAIAALLEHKTIIDAAYACRLSEKTLQRYLDDPAFRAALTAAETAVIDDAGRRLIAGQQKALDTLDELITEAVKESDRRLAATTWLEFALRLRELKNIEARLANLEEIIHELRKTTQRPRK